jgi:hypothetical protein
MSEKDSREWFEALRIFKERHKDGCCKSCRLAVCGMGECPMAKNMQAEQPASRGAVRQLEDKA